MCHRANVPPRQPLTDKQTQTDAQTRRPNKAAPRGGSTAASVTSTAKTVVNLTFKAFKITSLL